MIIGQSLASGTTAYSPWFDHQGDEATFYVDVIAAMSGVKLDITMQHKKQSEADSAATTAATFTQITTAGVKEKSASGLKEMVRFKYVVTDSGSRAWIHFRAMPTIWVTD